MVVDDHADIIFLKEIAATVHFFPDSGSYSVTLVSPKLPFASHAETLAVAVAGAREMWEQLTRPQ